MRTGSLSIASLVNRVDAGEIKLPEIQRAYVWKPSQVAGLIDSLYKRYPSGSVLLWETDLDVERRDAAIDGPNLPTMSKPQYLLDGQQRLTSLHRVFKNHERARVVFNVESERFQIESASTKNDLRWVRVGPLLNDDADTFELVDQIRSKHEDLQAKVINDRLQRVKKIAEYMYYVEILEGLEYSEVTEIFVRVNSRGRALRATDLALATLSARWPGVIERFDGVVDKCASDGYPDLEHTFLTRCLAAFASETSNPGDFAKVNQDDLEASWERLQNGLTQLLKVLKGNADIATSTLIPSVNALVPLVLYFGNRADVAMPADEVNALVYWLFAAFLQARYSGSATTVIAQDAAAVRSETPIENLFKNLGLLGQRLVVSEATLAGRGSTSPYFLFSYLAARRRGAKDWWHAVPICTDASGAYKIEYHHIHPRATLRDNFRRAEINDLANLAFISGKANRKISSRSPAVYFKELSDQELMEHFVPTDLALRTSDAYPEFIKQRRKLLATAMTELIDSYRPNWLDVGSPIAEDPAEGAQLLLAASGPGPDDEASVLSVHALHPGEADWQAVLPLADFRRFIADLDDGLAAELAVGMTAVTVEPGADVIEIPFGPLVATGTVEEWRKTCERELDDFVEAANPPAPGGTPWDGQRYRFPVVDSE